MVMAMVMAEKEIVLYSSEIGLVIAVDVIEVVCHSQDLLLNR